MTAPLLQISGLTVHYRGPLPVQAVRNVSLDVLPGQTVGVAGESGCGKSTLALAVPRLLPEPPALYVGGKILFEGKDLLSLPSEDLRRVRGAGIGVVFQDPFSALNPVLTIGDQIEEIHRAHDRPLSPNAALDLLSRVHLPNAPRILNAYPHQISGGQRQRVVLAMAIALKPKLLIADEPTTALDATLQGEILDLIDELKRDLGLAVLLVSHNIGLLSERADRLVVMYAGEIAESGPTRKVLDHPLHPYTQGLLASLPRLSGGQGPLPTLPGQLPDPRRLPSGCCFCDRCPKAFAACVESPVLRRAEDDHFISCHLYAGS
jgi:peptide/nickel transport system ATP-binding protein